MCPVKLIKVCQYQGNNSLLILHILFPHHGVGLACTRLTICKDADVVAFKGMKQHFLSDVFVHLLLRCIIDIFGLWTEINNWSFKTKNVLNKMKWLEQIYPKLMKICGCVVFGLRGCTDDLPKCETSRSNQS